MIALSDIRFGLQGRIYARQSLISLHREWYSWRMAKTKRRCPNRFCRRSLKGKLPHIEYCSADCRWRASGAPWERSSICLYCRREPVGKSGTVTCNSPHCRKSNALWHGAFQSTDGRIERVFAPDVALKSEGRCTWCSEPLTADAEFDHIIPRSVGGDHILANLQLLHPWCNREKGGR